MYIFIENNIIINIEFAIWEKFNVKDFCFTKVIESKKIELKLALTLPQSQSNNERMKFFISQTPTKNFPNNSISTRRTILQFFPNIDSLSM